MRVWTRSIAATSATLIATLVFFSLQCSAPAAQGSDRFAHLTELARPRAEHALLDDLVGEFESETHFALPGESASDWRGSTNNRWLLGGRFLQCEASSTSGDVAVESLRLLGFDPASRKFQSSTYESLSLTHTDASGTFDRDKRTIVFEVESKDPATGARTRATEVLRIVDHDHWTREIWGRGSAGEPVQLARAEYRRTQ